jgi:hypothetical protein
MWRNIPLEYGLLLANMRYTLDAPCTVLQNRCPVNCYLGNPLAKGIRVYKEPMARNGQPFCKTFEELKIQNKDLKSNWWFKNYQISSAIFSLLQTHISHVAHFNLMRQFLLPFRNKCSEISIFVFCVNNAWLNIYSIKCSLHCIYISLGLSYQCPELHV